MPENMPNYRKTIDFSYDKGGEESKGLPQNKTLTHNYTVFLFVNSISGSRRASEYTNLEIERLKLHTRNLKDPNSTADYEIELFIYDLITAESRQLGFSSLRSEQGKNAGLIRVIVAGGDGTVMWVVEECMKNHIDTSRIAIGVIPFGTGNDFSRVLGWGGAEPKKLLGKDFKGLKKLLYKWITAITEDFDIWEIIMEVHDNGGIKKIKKIGRHANKETLKSTDPNGKSIDAKIFHKNMCNYFSIGIESRIGLGFERNRAKSRLANKMVYAWEGVKKMFLKTHRINNVIDSVVQLPDLDLNESNSQQNQISLENKEKTVLTTRNGASRETDIKGNPSSLLCININSFMGGASDAWEACKNKPSGLQLSRSTAFGDQSFGDGKIEFLTFGSSVKLGLERMIKGQGRRVLQGKPPFRINFKGVPAGAQSLISYYQVDGEFFQIENPKHVTIVPHPNLPNGKIKVLIENSSRR